MAAVGHNHVIVNRSVQGWVRFDGALSGGGFFLTVPVSGFIVDESAARLQEGAEFYRGDPRGGPLGDPAQHARPGGSRCAERIR